MEHAPLNNLKVLHKLETIEKEVMSLKLSILKKFAPTGKKTTSFRGILKGVDITNEDIASAKKSLYSKTRV